MTVLPTEQRQRHADQVSTVLKSSSLLIYLPSVKYAIMGLAAKYGLNGVQCGVSAIKEFVWLCFEQKVQF